SSRSLNPPSRAIAVRSGSCTQAAGSRNTGSSTWSIARSKSSPSRAKERTKRHALSPVERACVSCASRISKSASTTSSNDALVVVVDRRDQLGALFVVQVGGDRIADAVLLAGGDRVTSSFADVHGLVVHHPRFEHAAKRNALRVVHVYRYRVIREPI